MVLYQIFIYPIELLIEVLFVASYKAFDTIGFSLIAISIFISVLTLPLYRRAEGVQSIEREKRKAMQPDLDRIKSSFRGDEQYMMVSTYYKQQRYHPLFALRSSVALLIQVPFFIAAYHFLSHLPLLTNESFLWISDLSQPDQLLKLGSITINVLPILMTLINIGAGVLYSKGFPLRDRVQLYAMACLFLVLLYQSPAGLVFYWTLNNVFSFVKVLFSKMKRPLPILYGLGVLASLALTAGVFSFKPNLLPKYRIILLAGTAIVIALPVLVKIWQWLSIRYLSGYASDPRERFRVFLILALALWVLLGVVIPLNTIRSSPIEFSFIEGMTTPLSFVLFTASVYLGLAVIWPILLYGIGSETFKSIMSLTFFILVMSGIINFLFFPGTYGTVSRVLVFDKPELLQTGTTSPLVSLFVSLLVVFVSVYVSRKVGFVWLRHLAMIVLLAMSLVSGWFLVEVHRSYTAYRDNRESLASNESFSQSVSPVFSLSSMEKNVVVFFLDRAINSFFPLIIDEFPELEEQFNGFTYYPNTVSFGAYTLTGAPAVMGGYEYRPRAINERSEDLLVDKHNESSLVLPRIFSDAGFDVSIFDPPYANYQWAKDFTAFEPYPEINVQSLVGRYSEQYKADHEQGADTWGYGYEATLMKRRFVMFSLFKSALPALRDLLYMKGSYFLVDESSAVTNQFIDSYATMYYLPELTEVNQSAVGSFVFLVNDATHDPIILQSPEYVPVAQVTDNTNPLQEDTYYDLDAQQHYQTNAAVLKQVGKWLSYLRENDAYDNTRIIIVSDHGRGLATPAFKEFKDNKLPAYYHPLFLVKDFDATGQVATDNQFMTNADVPLIAIDQLPVDQRNPFTSIALDSVVDKELVYCYYSGSGPEDHEKTRFRYDLSQSFTIHSSIFNEENWTTME